MSPIKPTGPKGPAAEQGKTVWLDMSTPAVEATPQTVDQLMEHTSTLAGRYRLLNMIGEGRMSRVYKAIDQTKFKSRATDPHVAVKVLTVPFVNNADAMEMLSREIESLKNKPHPNIAGVTACERDGDIVFIPMELLSGRSLQDKIANADPGGFSRTDALQIIKGIAEALQSAHARDFVHGDLKPSNVVLIKSGQVKVIDFGIARLMALTSGAATRPARATSRLKALASYASPEVLEVSRLDPRDDVFAMACIAWQLMTGEHPFGDKNAVSARDEGFKLTRPATLSQSEFDALSHGLEFERNRRTLSARQFFAELNGASSGSGGIGSRRAKLIAAAAALLLAVAMAGGLLALKSAGKKAAASAASGLNTAAAALASAATFRDCPGCPLMKVVAAGQFVQGSAPDDPQAQSFEQPQHDVAIGYPLAVGVFEVTVGQYSQFVADTSMESHSCSVYDGAWHANLDVSWENAVEGQTPAYPVSCVSWQDARRFAAWLSRRTHHLYRLPSASEWEHAARGGSNLAHPWTEARDACTYANAADLSAEQRYPTWTVLPCTDNYVQSAPVGSFAPNALGLYDMLGNVSEWVEDCWADTYAGAPTDGSARTDGDCSQREIRGGSWFTQPDVLRVAHRDPLAPDYRSTSVGFRLVRELTE